MSQAPAPRRSAWARGQARALAALLGIALALFASEIATRLFLDPEPYEATFFHRTTIADRDVLWRYRPYVEDAWPHPENARRRHVPFRTNAEGRREREFESEGVGEPLVIACLGDSSTAGYGVSDEEHYPYLLGTLLDPHVDRPLRVLNFGVMGYTSRQGLAQFERYVQEHSPDVVTIAFGYNDSYVNLVDENSRFARTPPRLLEGLHDVLERRSALYRELWSRAFPLGSRREPRPRVSREEFQRNVRTIVERVRAGGGRSVLIDLNVPNAYTRDTIRELAAELDTPHLGARELFLRHAMEHVQPFFPDLYLGQKGLPHIRVRWDRTVNPVLVFLDLSRTARPFQLVPLNDLGTHGDERAQDGLYSVAFPLSPLGLDAEFAITSQENLDRSPEHPNHILYRRLRLEPLEGFESPVWTAESWLATLEPYLLEFDLAHPNARGHELLARALAEALLAELRLR